jgi:hypothetical protein
MPLRGGPGGGGGGGGPAAGTYIPVADSAGVTVNTTTYDNGVTGSGKLTTLVFPQDTVAFALAIEGDAFPQLFLEVQRGQLWFGDGTFDPYNDGSRVAGGHDGGLSVGGPNGFLTLPNTEIYAGNLPTSDPGVGGQLYTVAGIVHVSGA